MIIIFPYDEQNFYREKKLKGARMGLVDHSDKGIENIIRILKHSCLKSNPGGIENEGNIFSFRLSFFCFQPYTLIRILEQSILSKIILMK